MDEKIKNEIMFVMLDTVNKHIMDKFNSGEELSFLDYFVFQATSYSISILHKNLFMEDKLSFNNCFVMRCLMEDIAIIKMYIEGDIPDESLNLLNKYNAIAEFSLYRKYRKDLDGKQYDFSIIKADYEKAKSKYRITMKDKNSNEFKKLINSKLPFLLNEYSFSEIVENYYNEFYTYYKILSVLVHPHDISVSDYFYRRYDFINLEKRLVAEICDIISDYYGDILNANQSLAEEYNYVFKQDINKIYYKFSCDERTALENLAGLIDEKMGSNVLSYTLRELASVVQTISIDEMYGYSEVIKCKFKQIVELLAINDYQTKLRYDENYYNKIQLINRYTKINLLKAAEYSEEEINKYVNEGYDIYKKIYSNGNKGDFEDRMNKTLGFMDNSSSINKLVYRFLEKASSDSVVVAHMKMIYDESQILSHANGYMIMANRGAFMECKTVVSFIDTILAFILIDYKAYWENYSYVTKENNNKFIYDIEKQIDLFLKVVKEKGDIYHTEPHAINRKIIPS